MIRVLFVSQTSACFELENDAPYYAPQAYQVICNGEKAFEGDSNVFSLFGLKPDASYELTLQFMPKEEGVSPLPMETCSFHTKADVCAINVRDFGATGDGKTDDTCAIQTAIHFLPKGGRLYFPAGTYSTLPLALKSHITLEFAEGATLLGSTDRASYPVLPGEVKDMTTGEPICFGTFEGLSQPMNLTRRTSRSSAPAPWTETPRIPISGRILRMCRSQDPVCSSSIAVKTSVFTVLRGATPPPGSSTRISARTFPSIR